MKKIIIGLGLGLGLGLAQAGEGNIDTKTTATMQATCSISANPIGFGAIATPLMMQTAQNDMTVKCSNASAYTVNLAYGGIYGTGSSNNGYSLQYAGNVGAYNQYQVFDTTGSPIGHIACGHTTYTGQINFTTKAVANLFGTNSYQTWMSNSLFDACSNYSGSGHALAKDSYPTGWSGAYDASGKQLMGGSGYSYGVMNGLSKGDKLAYSIQIPGDSSKVWNKGNNSYKGTGNGEEQTIPMIAKIVPDKSGSKYPAPDMYLDTVTAEISY